MVTPPRVAANVGHEDAARLYLEDHGWAVEWFGARTWEGTPAIMEALRKSRSPLQQAPDIVTARHGVIMFVEVMAGAGKTRPDLRCVPLQKLAALDAWSIASPVLCMDMTTATAWRHVPFQWPHDVVMDGPSTRYGGQGNGSGTPYVWVTREHEKRVDYYLA